MSKKYGYILNNVVKNCNRYLSVKEIMQICVWVGTWIEYWPKATRDRAKRRESFERCMCNCIDTGQSAYSGWPGSLPLLLHTLSGFPCTLKTLKSEKKYFKTLKWKKCLNLLWWLFFNPVPIDNVCEEIFILHFTRKLNNPIVNWNFL